MSLFIWKAINSACKPASVNVFYAFCKRNFICIFLAQVVFPAQCLYSQSTQQNIDMLVQPYIDSETLDGLCLGILHRGQTFVRGYGKAGTLSNSMPDGNTMYEIGSITKVFTGLLLADFVNRGKLRLDQSIAELIPAEMRQPHRSLSSIKLLHLSTHTSGLPRLPGNIDLTNIDDPYSRYTPDLLFEFLGDYRLIRPVVQRYEYSNLGVGLLGWLIARQGETDYEALLQQQILDPLTLRDTAITLSDSQKSRLAQGHDKEGDRRSPWEFSALVAAGGLRSTVNDMLKFASANLRPPVGDVGEAIELAWELQKPSLSPSENAMGLGWILDRDCETHFHNGETGGYHSMLCISRKHDLAVIALCNTASHEVDRLAWNVFKLLAGEKVQPRKFEPNLRVANEIMQRYVGVYQLEPHIDFIVAVEAGSLMVGLTGQRPLRVYPKSETEWTYRSGKTTFIFRQDKNGNWNQLVRIQNGIRHKAFRLIR